MKCIFKSPPEFTDNNKWKYTCCNCNRSVELPFEVKISLERKCIINESQAIVKKEPKPSTLCNNCGNDIMSSIQAIVKEAILKEKPCGNCGDKMKLNDRKRILPRIRFIRKD
jgi:hypothetical protein